MTILFADGFTDRLHDWKHDVATYAWRDHTDIDSRHGGGVKVFQGANQPAPTTAEWNTRRGVAVSDLTTVAAGVAIWTTGNVDRWGAFQFRTASGILIRVDRYPDAVNEQWQLSLGTTVDVPVAVAPGPGPDAWGQTSLKFSVSGASSPVEWYVGEELAWAGTLDLGTDPIVEVAVGGRLRAGGANRRLAFEDLWITVGDLLYDARVASLLPNAVGAADAWVPSDGTKANWEQVGKFPPDLAELVSTDTDGARDSHGLTDLPTDADRTDVAAVVVNAIAGKTDATDRDLALAVRTGAANFDATAQPITTTELLRHIWQQNPDTVAAWSKAEVDAMEAGYVAVKP